MHSQGGRHDVACWAGRWPRCRRRRAEPAASECSGGVRRRMGWTRACDIPGHPTSGKPLPPQTVSLPVPRSAALPHAAGPGAASQRSRRRCKLVGGLAAALRRAWPCKGDGGKGLARLSRLPAALHTEDRCYNTSCRGRGGGNGPGMEHIPQHAPVGAAVSRCMHVGPHPATDPSCPPSSGIPFSAFWLRSSVVSVLISLIADTWFIEPLSIRSIFPGGFPYAQLAGQGCQLDLGVALKPLSSSPLLHYLTLLHIHHIYPNSIYTRHIPGFEWNYTQVPVPN